MTTPSEPFTLLFRTGRGERTPRAFADRTEDLREENALSLVENQDIQILFRAPEGYRLTMDGLDVLARDAEETYKKPRHGWQILFEAKNFPLVPGYYVLTVEGRGRTRYTLIEIVPRYLDKRQWQDMRDELTEEIRHLSYDFMKRTLHVSGLFGNENEDDGKLLLRFYIVNDTADRVLHVLRDLSRTANSRITLKTKRIPHMSVRKEEPHSRPAKVRIGDTSPYTYVTATRTTWNIPENRFAKTLLLRLERTLVSFIEKIDRRLADTGEVQKNQERYRHRDDYHFKMRDDEMARFSGFRARAVAILSAVRLASDALWFRETEAEAHLSADTTLARDPRYAVLYRLFQNLRRPEDSLSVSAFYRFQWKRTDKLYELWCMLTFIKALAKKGWQTENGPAVREEDGQYLLDSLEPGAVIAMVRGEETLHLVYDADIPKSAAETSRGENPLYTNNVHRRPDLRIDHYRAGVYDGSLIADFKYRDIEKIWKDETAGQRLRTQFNAYRDMNTKWYRDLSEEDSLRNIRPVKEVWAVFPKEAPPGTDRDYSLRFISLAPGIRANERLGEDLETYFANLK